MRQSPIIPLGHLGGEAALSLERQRYRLLDRLGTSFAWLYDPLPPEVLEAIVQGVAESESRAQLGAGNRVPRVFISYARSRPVEADLTETTARVDLVGEAPRLTAPEPAPPLSGPPPPALVPQLPPASTPPHAGLIEITLPGGASVRVDGSVDSAVLRRVLDLLAGR